MSKQSLDEMLFSEEDESPQPQTAATPLEDVATEEYTPPPSTSITVIETHEEYDLIAWMSHQADAMPSLDSYDERKAVSYDMEKIEWKLHLNKPLRFHLFGVQLMTKPDKLTRENKEMETVILRNGEGKIIHDSKAILVDKCKTILSTRKDDKPIPVLIMYVGDKLTKAGQEAPNFEVKVLV